jgi:hypothetical protein
LGQGSTSGQVTEQTKEHAALAQTVMLAAVEPFKTGISKVFSQPT